VKILSSSDLMLSVIPKPILVDKNGKIIAIENELRGDNLDKTLAKYFKN